MNRKHILTTVSSEFDVSDLGHESVRLQVAKSDIVIGVDRSSGSETPFFGRALLAEIARGRAAEWEPGTGLVRITYDPGTRELERLCAAIQVLKGKHEYKAD